MDPFTRKGQNSGAYEELFRILSDTQAGNWGLLNGANLV